MSARVVAAIVLVIVPHVLGAQPALADSLRVAASLHPAASFVTVASTSPAALREAVEDAMRRAARAPARAPTELAAAETLALAFAMAWNDSLLLRDVARFARVPSHARAARVHVDSLRRLGNDAFARDGAAAAIRIWRRALPRALAVEDTVAAAALFGNIGAGFLRLGRLDSAEVHLGRARALAVRSGDRRTEANAVGELAGLSQERGDLAQARSHYLAALALRERTGDARGVAADHNNLGTLALELGDLDEARARFERALAIHQSGGRVEHAATNIVNLAAVAAAEGQFTRAAELYADAIAVWRPRKRWGDVADALRGIGEIHVRRGDYVAAQGAFREALRLLTTVGAMEDVLGTQRDLATAMAARGDYQAAIEVLRRAQRTADSAGVGPAIRAMLALARADLAFQLNSFSDADQLYRRADLLYREAGDAAGQAEAQHGVGLLLVERDEHVRAAAVFEAVMRMQRAAGEPRAAAVTRIALGQAKKHALDSAMARHHLAHAIVELTALHDRVASAYAMGELAHLEFDGGFPLLAESLYKEGLLRLRGLTATDVSSRLRVGYARALRVRGDAHAAAKELRLAVDEIERSSGALAVPERRSAYRADKLGTYVELAFAEHDLGRAAEALAASEGLRAREMLAVVALGRMVTTHDPRTVIAGDLISREQDLRRRIAELSTTLSPMRGRGGDELRGPDRRLPAGPAHEALTRAQDAYAALLLEIREQTPRHAGLVAPRASGWRDVASRLAPGEALVEYLVGEQRSLALVITRDTVVGVALPAMRRDLVRLISFVRGTFESPSQGDALWRAPLRRLYGDLIAPVEETGLLRGVTSLVIVPHLELHYLPFAALTSPADRFLIQRYALRLAPSASLFVALGDRARTTTDSTFAFAPRPAVLPASRAEARAALMDSSRGRVFVGALATEETFRRHAPAGRVLHFATYGVLNRHNPLFSYIELAPGGGHDGRLEVHEVFGLQLHADLVVLSACQTALGSGALADVPAGDDWVGFTRAFLHAGARQVLGTLWPVQDRATAGVMHRFYGALGKDSDPAKALAAAQRLVLEDRATAHPFYWAGFVVVGEAARAGMSK